MRYLGVGFVILGIIVAVLFTIPVGVTFSAVGLLIAIYSDRQLKEAETKPDVKIE